MKFVLGNRNMMFIVYKYKPVPKCTAQCTIGMTLKINSTKSMSFVYPYSENQRIIAKLFKHVELCQF